jgi:hypothetical protein
MCRDVYWTFALGVHYSNRDVHTWLLHHHVASCGSNVPNVVCNVESGSRKVQGSSCDVSMYVHCTVST